MNESPPRRPASRYAFIVARFVLVSGLVFLLWPFYAPAYLALVGFLMRPLLQLAGFDATLVERTAHTVRFEIIHAGQRGVVTPLSDLRPILLNMATLVGLFAGAFLPPRPRAWRGFLVAALLLLLYQAALGALLVVLALPDFAANGALATCGDLLFASRAFLPILLWLAFDADARGWLATALARVTLVTPAAAPEPRGRG